MRVSVLVGVLSLMLVGAVKAGPASAVIRMPTNIPPEPLDLALKTLAKDRQFEVLFRAEVVRDVKTGGAVGDFTPEEALKHLLIGTGLSYRYLDASTVTVYSAVSAHRAQQETTSPSSPSGKSKEAGKTSSQNFRMDQVDQANTGPQVGQAQSGPSQTVPEQALSEIVVTGTYLHNTAPITPVMTFTQADLVSQGYTTLADAIFDLPENFMGAGTSPASNPVNGAGGNGATNNSTYASGINLRGLGGNATLVLLNGRRMAPTAYGGTVDISQIPLSAIDRVEILTDGASSLYGSDAIAGVVNIITKKDFSGVEVGGRSTGISEGKTPNYGGDMTGGTSWDGGGLVASFDYEKDNPLWARNRPFSNTLPDPFALTPQQEAAHYFASIHQDITDRLSLSMDALATHRTYEAVDNIFANPVSQVANGAVNQYSMSPQLDFVLSSNWTLSLIGQWSREQDSTQVVYPPPQDAVILTPTTYQVEYVEPRVDGKLFDMPGGGVRLALGAQARQEELDSSEFVYNGGVLCGTCSGTYDTSRRVIAAYSELMIPIIGASNAWRFAQELRIDVSARYDHYSDFGGTTNPKVGISWTPVDRVKLHGSYSTSFQAPTLYDSNTIGQAVYVAPYVSPQSPTGSSLALNTLVPTSLQPETAKSYNFGLTLQPIRELTIDASYFDINFTNEITNLTNEGFCINSYNCTLQDQAELGSFFQRSPSMAEVNALLNNPEIQVINWAAGDYTDGPYTPSDITAIATLGNVNAASTRVRGVDLTPRYTSVDTSIGRFHVDLNASYYLTYRQQVTAGSSAFSVDNTAFNPLRFRARASVGWEWRGWEANARVNFANSYVNTTDTNCTAGCPISSWTTFDTGLSYVFPKQSGSWLRDLRLAVVVSNLFDRQPPDVYLPHFSGGNFGYDPVNANPFMRTIAVTFTKRFGAGDSE